MEQFTGKQRMALRNLLGAIILADGRIHSTELAEYSSRVCGLLGVDARPEIEAEWFLNRVDEIRDRMSGRSGQNWLREQLAILQSSPSMTDLLNAIWSVAVSDSDLHPSEADILDHAFQLWIARR